MVADRFWAKVQKTDGCWLWTGARKGSENYGFFYTEGKQRYAHRVSWEMANGPIPAGMLVCHRCDNPPCVRPDHLFIGTVLDNNRDAIGKGRKRYAIGERHGQAKLNPEAVQEIRRLKTSGATYSQLSNQFGVHRMTVCEVVHRKICAHVKDVA